LQLTEAVKHLGVFVANSNEAVEQARHEMTVKEKFFAEQPYDDRET